MPLLGNRVPRGRGELDGGWVRGLRDPGCRANVCEGEGQILGKVMKASGCLWVARDRDGGRARWT